MSTTATPATATQPCGTCQAPLADDQRYCLNCGTRRGEPRMDPLAHLMPTDERAVTEEATTVTTGPARGWLGTAGMLPLLGTLAVLAALGVGYLVGSSGDDRPVIAQRPPVVNITSAAGGPVDGTATTATADDASAAKDSKKSSKADEESAKDAEDAVKKAGGKVLSKDELAAAKNLSPEEARKRSAKLPAVVGTGGAPPPKDNKKAGGGTDAEVIK